jgi:DNA-binding MarR family transcriptional regulator
VDEYAPSLATVAQLFAHLTPRQVAVAASHHYDHETQADIAERHGVDRSTVVRDLAAFAATLERLGIPKPSAPEHDTRHVRIISDAVMKSL